MNVEQSTTPPAGPVAAPVAKARRNNKGSALWLLPVAILGGLLAWQWYDTRQQMTELRQDVARRLADAAVVARNEAQAGQQLLERSTALAGRLDAIEATLAEGRDQEEALQALYQDVAKGREEAQLLEIEQAITLAAQQIQLAGNVPVALLALRSADAQLARLDKARHLPLRKALAADISHLNELPLADIPGISLRLEQIVSGVEKFPFIVHGRPVEEASATVEPDDAPAPWWRLVLSDLWQETRTLIRIQRFDREEPALLAPGQGFFLRENLKLRLLSARLALFARDQWTFRNELSVARSWLERYFSTEDRAVQAAIEQLKELSAAEILIELPDLRASQQALVGLREGRETR